MAYEDFDPDDPDAPQEMDLDTGDDEEDARDCPFCGRAMHWDALKCNHCGQWLVRDPALLADSPAGERARGWFWPVMVAVLIAVILVIWHGLRR